MRLFKPSFTAATKPHYHLSDISLAKTSGVEGFEYEGRAGYDVLFAISCDERQGPVLFHFSSEAGYYDVTLDVLRRALDDAEARLLRDREEWKGGETWRTESSESR